MSITINGSTGISGVDGSSTTPAFQGTDTDTGLFYSANTVSVSAGGSKVATINAYGIGLGTGSPSSGIGITFPDTQSASSDANTLDDYEEGTFTPVLNRTTTSPTVTYAIQKGNYIKVGKFVFINVEIQITAVSVAGSGYNTVSGLPFAMSNTNSTWYSVGGQVIYNTVFSSGVVACVNGGAGQGNAAVSFLSQATATTTESNVNYQAGYLTFVATYIATA